MVRSVIRWHTYSSLANHFEQSHNTQVQRTTFIKVIPSISLTECDGLAAVIEHLLQAGRNFTLRHKSVFVPLLLHPENICLATWWY